MITRFLAALFIIFSLCAFKVQDSADVLGQPLDERELQDNLPKSQDPFWEVLNKTKINFNKEKGTYSAVYTDEIKKLSGTKIEVSGFMMPLEAGEKFKHFLISKRTPTCFFCPPGMANEIIDVHLKKPISWDSDVIKIRGKFLLMNDQQLGLFFKIEDGELMTN